MAAERRADASVTTGEDSPSLSAGPLMAPPLLRRMACWLYEGVLLFAVVFFAGWIFSAAGQVRDAMDGSRPLLQAFVFVVLGLYFSWFWTRGQTLAMKTWKIRVVDRAGRPLSQGRALLRYLCSWLWFLPALAVFAAWKPLPLQITGVVLAWVALWALLSRLHPQRQFWHDALAGTRLVPAAA
jgi:uncharacterized RDD family membrane protein YckC